MNIPEEQDQRELLLSQLVDGELPADEAGRLLADVLDDAAAREALGAMLRLRLALGPWRRQGPAPAIVMPASSIVMPAPAEPARGAGRRGRRLMGLAAAATLGGVLLVGGFYLGARFGVGQAVGPVAGQPEDPAAPQRKTVGEDPRPQFVVTPDERREIARVFALHESVAGPLSWYAADESSIELGSAQKQEALQQPIAVLLRLVPAGPCMQSEIKTYVIVCRSDDTAAIELPQPAVARAVRLRLRSTATDGEVNLQYAIAAEGSSRELDDNAALAGRRHLDLRQTSLGQLALEDCLVNVDASAWVIREEGKN